MKLALSILVALSFAAAHAQSDSTITPPSGVGTVPLRRSNEILPAPGSYAIPKELDMQTQLEKLYYQQLSSLQPSTICSDLKFDGQHITFVFRSKVQSREITVGGVESLNSDVFDASRKTKVIIHGWFQEDESFSSYLRNAFFKKENVNIIEVDWSRYATCEYEHTLHSVVPKVGEVVGNLIQELLEKKNYNAGNVHIIGFDMGAHIAGKAGRKQTTKIARITGLDPFGLVYEKIAKTERLCEEDAEFVDVIHTNGGGLGISEAIGHADFYVNGGNVQYACRNPIDIKCSHFLSVAYFVEAINKSQSFAARKCNSYNDYLEKLCHNNDKQYMGLEVSTSARGTYYLLANEQYPFGLSDNF